MLPHLVRQVAHLHSHRVDNFALQASLRYASHSSRSSKRWHNHPNRDKPRSDFELSAGEKRWRKQIDAIKKSIDSSPYKAIFGKSVDPFWSPSMWGPLMPSWISPGLGCTDSPVPNPKPSHSVDAAHDPVSNKTTQSIYDPIAHRMVPLELLHAQDKSASYVSEAAYMHTSSSSADEGVNRLTADSIRAAVGKRNTIWRSGPSKPPQSHSPEGLDHVYDPYPTSPIGLQTAYEKEKQDNTSGKKPSLSDELDAAQNPQVEDDGYGQGPTGMQTSYANEWQRAQGGQTFLERELAQFELASREAQRGLGAEHADEYPPHPIGLELSYAQEAAESSGQMSKLEQELAMKQKNSIEAQRGRGSTHDDEYPAAPRGLEVSYVKEDKISLEQELAQSAKEAREASSGLGSFHRDEFPEAPEGLQTSYREEQEGCEQGRRVPLEQELSQLNAHGNSAAQREHTKGKSLPSRSVSNSKFNQATVSTEKECQTRAYEPRLSKRSAQLQREGPQQREPHETVIGEGEIRRSALEFADGDAAFRSADTKKPVDMLGPSLNAATASDPSATPSFQSKHSYITWARPARYMAVTYDPRADTLAYAETTATTATPDDHVVPVSRAFAQLTQPAHFASCFSTTFPLGYYIIHASPDLLLFRLADSSPNQTAAQSLIERDGGKSYGQHGNCRQYDRGSSWGRRVRFALSVGACTAATVYTLGVVSEIARTGH